MVFDLDPGEGTSIVECCEVAGFVMGELAQQSLEWFAKTSGSKGLQLYAPVGAKATWDGVRDRAHEIARTLESAHPDLVVSNMRRTLRHGEGPDRLEPVTFGPTGDPVRVHRPSG